MKTTMTKKLLAIALIGLFSQFSMADDASSQKTIAGILVGLNHFPSDADKSALMAIAEDESNNRGTRAIASAVASISHAATAEDKDIMGRIMSAEQAPAQTKALAGVVAELNHMASADAKAILQAML
ncbi:MAG: hypothetical protein COA96_06490 [SAR86 cluster bacterium]|uniref:DUF2267 domain-containing protein n=1 Tax=SAR86 cluster bacterium TaxID=2030880 RepID=A0A2A5B3H7_9GAMM|nr:MAG: hypothetical protein COA96_06490 [SAR86 cluster bacterium]